MHFSFDPDTVDFIELDELVEKIKELLRIPADSAIEIREGMTMTVGHTVLAVPEVGGVRIEDTFAIGKDNAVPLTRFPKTFRLPAS